MVDGNGIPAQSLLFRTFAFCIAYSPLCLSVGITGPLTRATPGIPWGDANRPYARFL